jgi:hypothetical protein
MDLHAENTALKVHNAELLEANKLLADHLDSAYAQLEQHVPAFGGMREG